MRILIVGGGGREHAIAYKVSQSPLVSKIFCAPGNAGIEAICQCVPIGVMEFEKLADFACEEKIDLTIIGPDDPLVGGITDVFLAKGLRVFGPKKNAAILEGSKAFSKDLMKKYNIPTAGYENFDQPEEAIHYLSTCFYPIVLKADGLALGKGVLICNDFDEAKNGVHEIMIEKKFGASGNRLVVEEFMTGREVSVLAFCDGTDISIMTSAQDHKRALDGDQGLNTGGMGTFSPSPFYTKEIDSYCQEHIYKPTMAAMKKEGRDFVGILFFGLMLTDAGPKVLEYNARFGDPETQVVLPRLKNDLVEIFEACIDGRLKDITLTFEDNAAVCVILASEGYPGAYEKGYVINGLEQFEDTEGYYAFHSGTSSTPEGIVTNGGRVLGITATGEDLRCARENAYKATEWVTFENKYMRRDIGKAIEDI
ncbi:MAG: phosphoribosylamine--glycine ligase [Anaerocolumna sp.]